MLLFSGVSSLLVLVPTLFMLQVYDRVLNSRNLSTLGWLLVIVLFAYAVMECLELVRLELMEQAALELDESLRLRLFDRAFDADVLRGGRQASGQLFNDLKTLREFMSSPALLAMLDAPAALVFLGIVAAISPWLGLMALFGAVLQGLIMLRTERHTLPGITQANQAAMTAQNYASGLLRQAPLVEAMGMRSGLQERWLQMQQRFIQLQAGVSDQAALDSTAGRFVQTLMGSLILGASCWLSLQGGLIASGGMMILASTLGARVLSPLAQLAAQWRSVVQVRDAIHRLGAQLGDEQTKAPAMPLGSPKGVLTLDAVSATAPGSTSPVLLGLSFVARPGEVLVVVGPSASGKSSLARLITGVWPASAGKVRLDGADLYAWDKSELGAHVGYLAQGVELFAGTLAENIARFESPDEHKLQAAVDMAGLQSLIDALPEGQNTPIGDAGAYLSGGQRQRVGLARAVYGLPRLVVLDEPNASLDQAGDLALNETLRRLAQAGSTVIVMSQRPGILPVADKMLVMREGQVALFGPRDDVMAALQRAAQGKA